MNNIWKNILNEAKYAAWAESLLKNVQKDVVNELKNSYKQGKNRVRFINWLVSTGSKVSGLGGGDKKTATNIYDNQVLKLIMLALEVPVEFGDIGSDAHAVYLARSNPAARKIIVSNSIIKNIENTGLKDSGYARYGLHHDVKHEFFHAIDHFIGNQLTQIKDRNINWRLFSDPQKKTLKQIGKKNISDVPGPLQVYLKDPAEGYAEFKSLQLAIDKLGKPITPELIKRLCKRKWSFNKKQTAIMSYIKAKQSGDSRGMKKYAFWNRAEDAVLALPILHAIDCTESGYRETALQLQKLAGVDSKKLSKTVAVTEIIAPEKEIKALVFGHSQTQGMGQALIAALKNEGIKSSQIVYAPYPGRNDKALAGIVKKVVKNPSSFTHAFLYLGGNLSGKNPSTMTGPMREIINYFTKNGVKKDNVFVTLPPVNEARIQRAMTKRPSKRDLAYWKKKTKKDRSANWIKWRMNKWVKAQDFFESFLKTQLNASNVIRVSGRFAGDSIHARMSDSVTTDHIGLIFSKLSLGLGYPQASLFEDSPPPDPSKPYGAGNHSKEFNFAMSAFNSASRLSGAGNVAAKEAYIAAGKIFDKHEGTWYDLPDSAQEEITRIVAPFHPGSKSKNVETAAKTKVLICGNSQAQNMGGAVVRRLKDRGHSFRHEVYNGANDEMIANTLPRWAPDPSIFTHVVVYCGGNVQNTEGRITSIKKIIDYFTKAEGGPPKENIFLVLPPMNKKPITRRIKNKANDADISWARTKYEKELENKTDEYVRIFIQRKALKSFQAQTKLLKALKAIHPKENVIKVFGNWNIFLGRKPPHWNPSIVLHANKIIKRSGLSTPKPGFEKPRKKAEKEKPRKKVEKEKPTDIEKPRKKVEKEKTKPKPISKPKVKFDTPTGKTLRTDLDIPAKMSDQIRAHFGLPRKSLGLGDMKIWDPAGDVEQEKERLEKLKKDQQAAAEKRRKEEEEKRRADARERNRQKKEDGE